MSNSGAPCACSSIVQLYTVIDNNNNYCSYTNKLSMLSTSIYIPARLVSNLTFFYRFDLFTSGIENWSEVCEVSFTLIFFTPLRSLLGVHIIIKF